MWRSCIAVITNYNIMWHLSSLCLCDIGLDAILMWYWLILLYQCADWVRGRMKMVKINYLKHRKSEKTCVLLWLLISALCKSFIFTISLLSVTFSDSLSAIVWRIISSENAISNILFFSYKTHWRNSDKYKKWVSENSLFTFPGSACAVTMVISETLAAHFSSFYLLTYLLKKHLL